MGPADTKTLRIEYNNKWPARFPFPLESQFAALLAEKNVVVPFKPAPLAPSDDAGFHRILASILDALDALPLRPDRAFEALWTAIDAEAFRVFDTGKKTRLDLSNFLHKLRANRTVRQLGRHWPSSWN